MLPSPFSVTPPQKPVPGSQSCEEPEEWASSQCEVIFASLPDAVLACDRDGKLFCMNDAALKLFEVSSTRRWLGKPYREFLQSYTWCDEQQHPIFFDPWLLCPVSDAEAASHPYEQTLMINLPSGRRVLLELRCSSLLDAESEAIGMVVLRPTNRLVTIHVRSSGDLARVSVHAPPLFLDYKKRVRQGLDHELNKAELYGHWEDNFHLNRLL